MKAKIQENVDLKTFNNNSEINKKMRIYDRNRRYMRTGDVIAFQGSDPGAKLIQKYTKSNISHVGLVMDVPGINRKFIIESVPVGGVVIMPLSFKLKVYAGSAWWMPITATKVSRDNLYKDMMLTLGEGYDFEAIKKFAKKIFSKKHQKPSLEDYSRLICSELVGKAFKLIKIINIKTSTSEMTPKDVAELNVYRKNIKLL